MTTYGDESWPPLELQGIPVPQRGLPAMLDLQAGNHADKQLLRIGDLTRTYAQARDAAAAMAGALREAGVQPGDRVAVMCGNRIELWDFVTGAIWLGAIAVPLNTALRGEQLSHALTNSGSRFLVIERDLVELLGYLPKPPDLERVWALDGVPEEVPAGYDVAEPPAGGAPEPLRKVRPGDPVAIMYTSGTTGPSKGVIWPSEHFYWWGVTMNTSLRVTSEDVLYNCLPMYHGNALVAPAGALVAGASSAWGERFSASRFWENAAAVDGTVSYLLGALANRLLSQPPKESDRAHRIRAILAPGTAAPLWEPFCERFGVEHIVECYGMTEVNHCIGRPPGYPPSPPGTMGWVLDEWFEVKIFDEDDQEVPPDTPGEIVLRNKDPFSFAIGYWGMPEKTAEAQRNLWFHSGDRGAVDENGLFRFVDRAKDSMRRLGENISSWEVEEAILTHPSIAEVAVYPVRSDTHDEEVMAAVVLRGGETLDPAELLRHLEPRLAYFAIPRYIEVVEVLDYTTNGKVQKAALRERGVTEATWDRQAAGYKLAREAARTG